MNQRLYTIPKSEWEALKAMVSSADAISEEDAAKLLGITTKSLREARCRRRITPDCYTIPKAGKVVYLKSKLLNLK
jgi:hypothetical protein